MRVRVRVRGRGRGRVRVRVRAGFQTLVGGLIEGRVDVIVLAGGRDRVLATLVVADVHGDGVVARLGQRPPPTARHAL